VEELQEKRHIKGNGGASFFVNPFLLSALCLAIVFAVANDEK